jgi:hypothetical protein
VNRKSKQTTGATTELKAKRGQTTKNRHVFGMYTFAYRLSKNAIRQLFKEFMKLLVN